MRSAVLHGVSAGEGWQSQTASEHSFVIGRLVGKVVERESDRVLLDVMGVGYDVQIPLSTFYRLGETDDTVTLYTHLSIRDDAHVLFGFFSPEERVMFRSLIKVNGVGPKMALGILSGLETESFVAAVRAGDVKTLTGLPGVGKKTAERLILDMKDRLSAFSLSETAVPVATVDVTADAEAALINLGYKPAEAALAVSRIESPADDIETLIKQALQQLLKNQ